MEEIKFMRKILEKQTLLYPMPVLIIGTYDENGKADAMNAAWGGIKDTNQIYICLSIFSIISFAFFSFRL